MRRVLAILIDAFRYDYISEKETPFLYQFSEEGRMFPLQPILGYSNAIKATTFTGTYPDENNYWMEYRFRPETSPFKDLSKFAFIDRAPGIFHPWLKLVLTRLKRRRAIHNLPLSIAPLFDYSLSAPLESPRIFGNIPTIFDVLRDNNIIFEYISSNHFGILYFWSAIMSRQKILTVLNKLDPDVRFIFMYLHYLDNAGHRYGITSRMFRRELQEVDSIIRSAINHVKNTYNEMEIIVFSDHGMTDAKSYINFNKLVNDTRFGKEFFFLTDSTMVRVWYNNHKIRDGIRALIQNISPGHFISPDERQELHLDFNNRYYGDDIYLIDPPYNIFPNSTSLLKPLAMHAYHPYLESQQGIAIFKGELLNKVTINGKHVSLTDFMPTILSIFDLKAPSSCRGTSLI